MFYMCHVCYKQGQGKLSALPKCVVAYVVFVKVSLPRSLACVIPFLFLYIQGQHKFRSSTGNLLE
jgi:hypothetical protein